MNEKEMVISDLLYRSEEMDRGKSDSVVAPAQLRWFGKYVSFQFGPEAVWADVAGSVPLPLNLHAFRQVCAKLGAAVWTGKGRASQQAAQRSLPVDFLLALPDEITEKNMNWAFGFPLRKRSINRVTCAIGAGVIGTAKVRWRTAAQRPGSWMRQGKSAS